MTDAQPLPPVRYRHSGAATVEDAAVLSTRSISPMGKDLMARTRNLKPGFFTNEQLAELHPLTRLLYGGLWCHADREGRLEDRPKKIKAEILAFDDHDVNLALQQLHDAGFILRYKNCEASYIQILAFDKHQHPHPRELKSDIPAPDLGAAQATPRHGPGNAKVLPRGSPPPKNRLHLIDPPPLDPGSSLYIQKADVYVDSANGALVDAPPADKKSNGKRGTEPPPCLHQAIIDLYHERLPMCPKVRVWHRERQRLLTALWREDPDRQDLKWWDGYFAYVAESRFLTGREKPKGSRSKPFVASLEWLIRPSNFTKVYEGQYE